MTMTDTDRTLDLELSVVLEQLEQDPDPDARYRLTVAGVLELPDAFTVAPYGVTWDQRHRGVEWGGRAYRLRS